jgi:hypothetical protein
MKGLPAMGPAVRRLVRSAGLDVEPKRPVLIDLLRAHGEMLRMMEEHGYALELIEPVVFEPTSHRLLQIDCSFFRPGA